MRAAPSVEPGHFGLMDLVYRRQRHVYDLTRKYFLLGRDTMLAGLAVKPGESLVEIGSGTARNLILLARRHPGLRLYGLDASAQMLETARESVARAGLEARIRLRHGLAEQLSPEMFGERGFDHVLFSYSLSMIADWRRALAVSNRALSPQGLVHIVDFGDFRSLPGRRTLTAWLALFHVQPRVELLAGLEAEYGKSGLILLPGRYAFLLSLAKGNAGSLLCGTTDTGGG